MLGAFQVWLNYTMLPSEVTTFRMQPFFAQGGILESASVAQAVNDMLLTSQGHGLRLFPIWAAIRPTESASFRTLRAKGAFLVSASYDGVAQRVGNVTILSEAGVLCRVLSPWPRGAAITVTNGGTAVRAKVGPRGWLEFATEAGHLYELAAA